MTRGSGSMETQPEQYPIIEKKTYPFEPAYPEGKTIEKKPGSVRYGMGSEKVVGITSKELNALLKNKKK